MAGPASSKAASRALSPTVVSAASAAPQGAARRPDRRPQPGAGNQRDKDQEGAATGRAWRLSRRGDRLAEVLPRELFPGVRPAGPRVLRDMLQNGYTG